MVQLTGRSSEMGSTLQTRQVSRGSVDRGCFRYCSLFKFQLSEAWPQTNERCSEAPTASLRDPVCQPRHSETLTIDELRRLMLGKVRTSAFVLFGVLRFVI